MSSKLKSPLLLLLLCTALLSCRKDNAPEWDLDMNIPLFNASLGIQDLIADSLLQVNGDHTLTLVFNNSLYDFNLDSIVSVPDTISHKYLPALPGITINPGQDIFNQTEVQNFDFSGAEVTRIDLRAGTVSVEFVNTIPEEVVIQYRITSATKNGQPFEIYEVIPAASGAPYHYIKSFDISGYSLDMTGLDHLSSNKLVTWSKASLAATAAPVTLTASDEFDMLVMFHDVQLGYARGYFAQQEFSWGPDETEVNFFRSITGGSIDLESMNVALYIENGFGLDARVKFKSLSSINTRTGNVVNLNSNIIGSTVNIARALETGDPQSPVEPTKYNFDLTGSNVLEMIENLPDKIGYELEVMSNPLGNISGGNDFVYYGNYLKTCLDMEIPLSLRSDHLSLVDTIVADLGDPANSTGITQGTLTMAVDNGLPLDAEIVLTVVDSLGQTLSVLIDHKHISNALLNDDGFAENPMHSVITVPLERTQIDQLYAAKFLVVQAIFNTAPATSGYVKIYDSYRLNVRLSAKFNYVIQD